ncbi:CPBP family intramembrane glutamic endopeptidase [Flavobacterium hydatis]|uniref:Abortive infection protein n=1 Tax=Flavobacterium hydatis TaxID=991 RepID=A0A086ARV0_FLAHY|nr:type II CAAX endopeptidase family protein [Flavobacterium hydatis]KFF19414.1 abortive infection protein [Flavobacterium hydatis]OXA96457.1 CAAX protease family protein [Flavobacterium hydatis]
METFTTKQKIFNFPLTKIILALIICMAFVIIGQQIAGKLLGLTPLDKNYRNLIKGIIVSLLAITSYIIFFKKYEKREVTELSTNGIARNLIVGTLIGAVLQSLTILVIYLNGSFSIISVNPVSFIIIPLTIAFTIAIIEEILIRGIIFRVMEEKLGSYIALIISALIFGALHLPNAGSTLLSGLCIAVEAGLLLGAAFMYSRNLWFPIALHFAWNFTQSGIFGAITSGNEKSNSLLVTKIEGSTFITGGEFGPEGTIQAAIFCTIATVILLFLCHKENKIILPYWKNK